MDINEAGTLWMLRNTDPTPLTGAAIKAGAEDSWSAVIGENEVLIDDGLWATGTHQLHFAAEDGSGNISSPGDVVEYEKVAAATPYTHVLNPAAGSSGLRYTFTANTIFNIATSKSAGYWFGGYAYFDGTNWTGDILSAADSAATTGYLAMSGNAAIWRSSGGSDTTTVALSTPGSTGWYFVTAHWLIKEAADGSPGRVYNFWRNGTLATPFSNASNSESGFIAMNRFGFGHRADSTPTEYNNFETCGLCWGTGDPTLMHAWVYNGGTLKNVADYNFAGDANGCTLGGFWPAGRNSGATFSVTDTQLDDAVGSLDDPTLVGTMEWASLTGPIGD
jgi:hypothetical protein